MKKELKQIEKKLSKTNHENDSVFLCLLALTLKAPKKKFEFTAETIEDILMNQLNKTPRIARTNSSRIVDTFRRSGIISQTGSIQSAKTTRLINSYKLLKMTPSDLVIVTEKQRKLPIENFISMVNSMEIKTLMSPVIKKEQKINFLKFTSALKAEYLLKVDSIKADENKKGMIVMNNKYELKNGDKVAFKSIISKTQKLLKEAKLPSQWF